MRKVILQMELSLDGFTAAPDGDLSWLVIDPEGWKERYAQFEGVDTVLLGRHNYEGFYGYWPAVADNLQAPPTDRAFARWLNDAPKVVFSRTLDKVEWQHARLAQDDIATEVAQLKAQPGKDILLMNSATLAHSFLDLDLIDTFWLSISPVAIGKGRPLFDGLTHSLPLRLVESKAYASGSLSLVYDRVRS